MEIGIEARGREGGGWESGARLLSFSPLHQQTKGEARYPASLSTPNGLKEVSPVCSPELNYYFR